MSAVRRRTYGIYNARHRRSYPSRLDRVPSRDEIPALLNARRLLGVGVEVGVRRGKYSDLLLRRWHGMLLVSVDPWSEADPDEYLDVTNVSQPEHEQNFQTTLRLLRRHGSRSVVWRSTSLEAAARLTASSLDFVYLDARHDYESVTEDLEAWYPKLRPTAILAGHDYVDGELPGGRFDVRRAVDEFCAARGLVVCATEGRPPAEIVPSWLLEVPRVAG